MDVLALDLSKSGTGWARYRKGDDAPTYGTWVLGSSITDDAGALLALYKRWQEMTAFGEPHCVYFEQPLLPNAQRPGNAVLTKLAGMIEFLCAARRIRCYDIHNGTWKAAQLKNGRMDSATAKMVSNRMARELGMKPRNDNEADALHILDFALGRELITPPWRSHETLFPMGGAK